MKHRSTDAMRAALVAALTVSVAAPLGTACGGQIASNGAADGGGGVSPTSDGGWGPSHGPAPAPGTDGGAAPALPHLAQMNDVSILYPAPTTPADVDRLLRPTTMASAGALLPRAMWDATGGDEVPPVAEAPSYDYASLRLLALRFDPCAQRLATTPVTEPCVNQLRLTFQTTVTSTNGPQPVVHFPHTALQVNYGLSREELLAAVREIVEAREAARGGAELGPLAPHPILTQDGITGSFGQALERVILRYAGEQRVTRIARARATVRDFFFTFRAFDLAGGAMTASIIPSLPPPDSFVGGFVRGLPPVTLSLMPLSTSQDSIALLAGRPEAANAATPAQRQASFDAALRVENPQVHSPATIDCATCHTAGSVIGVARARYGLLRETPNPNTYVAQGVPAASLQVLYPSNTGMLIFGHDVGPVIAQRVVNETASVVATMNAILPAR